MVLHNSDDTIRLVQAVDAFYDISVAVFVLTLDIVSVGVLYFICELILGMTLNKISLS